MSLVFEEMSYLFFHQSFSSFVYFKQQEIDDEEEDDDDEDEDTQDEEETDTQEQDQIPLYVINHTCRLLKETGLVKFMDSMLLEILYDELETRINKNAQHIHDQYFLEPYYEWLDEFVRPWLEIVCLDSGDSLLNPTYSS